jgi:lipopolysaccharide transport system ATP-binding protein
MYMRLAFAVAAFLEPDILVVDEVLAVGDAEFQKKCLGRMQEVTGEGRTVLFVSHNMASIRTLCERAIMLERGRIVAEGDVQRVLDHYLSSQDKADDAGEIAGDVARIGSGAARIRRVQLLDDQGDRLESPLLGQPFTVSLGIDASTVVDNAVFEVGISRSDGTRICTSFSTDSGEAPVRIDVGTREAAVRLDLVLLPGRYSLDLGVHHAGHLAHSVDYIESVLDFEVVNVPVPGVEGYPYGAVRGSVRPVARWSSDAAAVREPLGRAGA